MARKRKPAIGSRDTGPVDEVMTSDEQPLEAQPEPPTITEAPTPAPQVIEAAPPPAPVQQRLGVKLEIYLRVCGKRMDQMGGFRRWAMDNGLTQMEVKEWHQAYQKFLSLPV